MSSSDDWQKYALIAGGGVAIAAALYFLTGGKCCSEAKKEVPFPLVHKTWKSMLAKVDGNFGTKFYPNLFANPGVKETFFFTTDKPAQQMNLTKGLSAVLGLVESGKLEEAFGALGQLGLRHLTYCGPLDDGIKAAYGLVGATVIKTLKENLGDEFTPEAEKEWGTLYGIVCEKCYAPCYDQARAAPFLKKFYQNRLGHVTSSLITDSKAFAARVAAAAGITSGLDKVETFFGAALNSAASEGSLAPLVAAAKNIPFANNQQRDKFAAAITAGGAALTPYDNWCLTSGVVAALKQ